MSKVPLQRVGGRTVATKASTFSLRSTASFSAWLFASSEEAKFASACNRSASACRRAVVLSASACFLYACGLGV